MINNIFKKLKRSDELLIESLFHQKMLEGKKTRIQPASPSFWRDVIGDFFIYSGNDIFTAELREAQDKVVNRGLSKEYVAALIEVVDHKADLDEHVKMVLLLTATPDEHEKALAKIGFR